MKKHITLILACLIAAIACENERPYEPIDPDPEDNPKDTTEVVVPVSSFQCTYPDIITRPAEAISLFTQSGEMTVLDSLTANKDNTLLTYYGALPESDMFFALSPARNDATFWMNSSICEFSTRLPYDQKAVEGGFDPDAVIYIGETDQGRISFSRATALLKITIKDEGIKSVRIDADEEREGAFAGLAAVRLTGGRPEVLVDRQDNCSFVRLNGEFKDGASYYAGVFPGTYTNVRYTVTDKDGEEHTFEDEDGLVLTAGQTYYAAILDIDNPGGRIEPEREPRVVIANEVFVPSEGVSAEAVELYLQDVEGWDFQVSCDGCVEEALFDFETQSIIYSVAPNASMDEATGTIWFTLSKEGHDDLVFDIVVIQEGKEIVVPSGEELYKRLTQAPASWEGTYLIVCTSENLAATGEISSDGWLTGTKITYDGDGNIARTDATQAIEVRVESYSGAYTVRFANGGYLGSTDDNGGIMTSSSVDNNTKQFLWDFNFSGTDFKMYLPNISSRALRYNSRGFRAYSGTTGSAVTLFKYEGDAGSYASVTTSSSVTAKGENSATIHGSYKAGDKVPSRIGFKYGTGSKSMNMTAYAETPSVTSGEFSVKLTGLTEGTTYYYQAFMVLDYETYGGSVCSFMTEGTIHVDPNLKADYGWFELPAQRDLDRNGIDDDNKDYYYSHTFRADAPRIRNFSCCYSKSKIHPVWVAAPMHSSYKGNSGRNDSYKPDPNIHCTQNGRFSGYTRGHMLGSSDRTISKETNRQVFYYSNIGAQLQSGFNTGGGAWNNLEDFVDGQWCSDTLYQVIGCIFEKWTDRYGSTISPRTSDGSQIPTAYYKVLLRTKSGRTGKKVSECSADELKCAAFILKHSGNAGHRPSSTDLYTVEEVEELTGLTFFVNVPNAPKGVAKASDWGL